MVSLEINDAVVLEQQQVLEQALSTNPKTQKALQKLIRKAIMQARAELSDYIKTKFDNGDPRGAARAVRTSVYRKILGGNINILNGKKAHGTNSYEPPRTLRPGQRGGNRRPRSVRTNKVMHYAGEDRGFILRFVNSGTKQRAIERLMNVKGTNKFQMGAECLRIRKSWQYCAERLFPCWCRAEVKGCHRLSGRPH